MDRHARHREWQAWKAAHWPVFAALEAGDIGPYQRSMFARIESVRQSRRAACFCVHCHALMAVAESGVHFCPYGRGRDHDRAKAILAPSRTIDMLEWTKAKVSEVPAQRLHLNQPPRKVRSAAINSAGVK